MAQHLGSFTGNVGEKKMGDFRSRAEVEAEVEAWEAEQRVKHAKFLKDVVRMEMS